MRLARDSFAIEKTQTSAPLKGMQGDAMRLGRKERAGDHHLPCNYTENKNAKKKNAIFQINASHFLRYVLYFCFDFFSRVEKAIFASGTGSMAGHHGVKIANLSAVGHNSTHTIREEASLAT